MKKNDWVQFYVEGNLVEGMVIKSSDKLTVAFAHKNGNHKKVQGTPRCFTKIKKVNLDTSGIMDGYEVKKYKESGGEETTRFEAKLYKDGIYIALVSNGGNGGFNDYSPVGNNHDEIAKYFEDVKQWAIHYGSDTPSESEHTWIHWQTTGKKTGQSAQLYWDDLHEFIKKGREYLKNLNK